MMGLKESVFWASHCSQWLGIFFIVATTCTIAMFIVVFEHTSFVLVWSFIFTFLISVEMLGLLITTAFSDPGTASITAVFTYLIGIYLPGALLGVGQSLRIGGEHTPITFGCY